MGILSQSIRSFSTVYQCSKDDALLRGAISVFGVYPFYSLGGIICSIYYQQYLDRRSKRIARKRSCGARLTLNVSKEKAESDDWQKELISDLAKELEVLETRLTIEGVSEARGEVYIRIRLTARKDASDIENKELPCDEKWRYIKPGGTGSLVEVKAVVVDGATNSEEDAQKMYSIWLVPKKKKKEECDKIIKSLSENYGGPQFEPHVTLLGGIKGKEEDVQGVAEKLAQQIAKFPISFSRIVLGGSYFRSIILEAKPSEELSAAHVKAYQLLPSGLRTRLPFVRSCQYLDTQTRSQGYYPHLSLAYTEKPPEDAASIEALHPNVVENSTFDASEVVVWETDPADHTLKSWKEVGSFKLQGQKPASFFSLFKRFAKVAAPEFLQIAAGTGLNLAANLMCDMACESDTDLYSGHHVGKSNKELAQVIMRGLLLWGGYQQLNTWSRTITRNAGTKIGARLKGRLFQSLMQQDVKWISQKGADELYKTLMERSSNVERMFTDEIPEMIEMCADITVNIGMLWLTRPRLCAFGFGLFAFQNMNNSFFSTIQEVAEDHETKVEATKQNTLQVLQNFRIVRAFVREKKEADTFQKSLLKDLVVRTSDIIEKFTSLGTWFGYEFSFQIAYIYGGYLVNKGYIQSSQVKDAVQKTFKSMWPLYQIRWRLQHKSTFREDAASVLEALERPPEIPFDDEAKYSPALSEVRGEIEADMAHFSYSDDQDSYALKEVSFKIPAGSMVGLVGPSGCGKSTLFSILLRFYDIQSGSLKIDGVELKNWNPQALYRSVAWVSQDQAVFAGTVLDNIRYGSPEATEADVLNVMKDAALYDDLIKKEKGILTEASELSGGQKQRLSIARALLRNPKILLLDEATSALDTASERKVQKAFEKLVGGRTVIAIAHRLSTIMNSDLILAMEAGKIIEQGTHSELLKKSGGKYADLVHQQLAVDDDKAAAETTTEPQAVIDASRCLKELREKVPEELREELEKAAGVLNGAAETLKKEKQRLSIKEQCLLGRKPWRAAKTLRNAMHAVTQMQKMVSVKKKIVEGSKIVGSADAPASEPPTLERAVSNMSNVSLERAISMASELAAGRDEDELDDDAVRRSVSA